ncbi:DNA topoisomerase 6 subunit A [Candidatus Lokiarchaeum ossiferum]|uniref:DNA topoisomerase (ATP-hydrolyzing) n=1 Tax=Candidatus Lokiarchaeum ossiferum TaxID=2951803 RepID=A0ABY6HPU5_9ARCH|nr:DNA topoisomerase 6 subunit A [Candidatus Lokiarchaeum sp. B-35]
MAKKSTRKTTRKTTRRSSTSKNSQKEVTASRNLRSGLTMNQLVAVRNYLTERQKEADRGDFVAPEGTVQIDELTMDKTLERIDTEIRKLVFQIENSGNPSFSIPKRSASNIIYDEEQDILLLGNQQTNKALLTLTSAQDTTRVMEVIKIIHELLTKRKHMTKREVFYGNVNLFKDQKFSDACIEDVSALLHTTRNSTGIVAKARGSAVGRLRLKDGNEIIDLDRQGSGSWSITPMIDKVDVIESDAEFILVLEKDAAMMRIIEEKWWKKFPCITLTAEGVGNVATRMFLKKINSVLKLPTFCLVDADPYGHYIYSVYIRGSKRLSYESPFLATPDMHLLGVLSRDLDEYGVDYSCRIPMDKVDIKRLDDMLSEPYVRANRRWREDLELMKKMKMKAEIQALSSHGIEYLTDTYLPNKLYSGDWI